MLRLCLEPVNQNLSSKVKNVLELRARSRTGSAIKALLNLAPPAARKVLPGGDQEIPLDQVKVGEDGLYIEMLHEPTGREHAQ